MHTMIALRTAFSTLPDTMFWLPHDKTMRVVHVHYIHKSTLSMPTPLVNEAMVPYKRKGKA